MVLASAGFFVASNHPDALEAVGRQLGVVSSTAAVSSPLADYKLASLQSGDLAKASAGFIGLAIVYFTCMLLGRFITQRRSA